MNSDELKLHLKNSHNIEYDSWKYITVGKKLYKCEQWNCNKCEINFVFNLGEDSDILAVFHNGWKIELNTKSFFKEYERLACGEFEVKEIIE